MTTDTIISVKYKDSFGIEVFTNKAQNSNIFSWSWLIVDMATVYWQYIYLHILHSITEDSDLRYDIIIERDVDTHTYIFK